MGSTIREGGTQHWAGKALSLSNERWLKRARGAALKRDRSSSGGTASGQCLQSVSGLLLPMIEGAHSINFLGGDQ